MSLRDIDKILDGAIRSMSRRAFKGSAIPFPPDIIEDLGLPGIFRSYWLQVPMDTPGSEPISSMKHVDPSKPDRRRFIVSYDLAEEDFEKAIIDKGCTGVKETEYRQIVSYSTDPGAFDIANDKTWVLPEVKYGVRRPKRGEKVADSE